MPSRAPDSAGQKGRSRPWGTDRPQMSDAGWLPSGLKGGSGARRPGSWEAEKSSVCLRTYSVLKQTLDSRQLPRRLEATTHGGEHWCPSRNPAGAAHAAFTAVVLFLTVSATASRRAKGDEPPVPLLLQPKAPRRPSRRRAETRGGPQGAGQRIGC